MEDKPKNINEYYLWLQKNHNIDLKDLNSNYFESVVNKIENNYNQSDFWTIIEKEYVQYDQEYTLKTGYPLFINSTFPKIYKKNYDSFILKTFRKNVINNKNFPNEPEGGWLLPSNWYSNINDIVRTLFVVKYLDGVEFLLDKLCSVTKTLNISYKCDYEAKEEGYYAVHFYVKKRMEIPKITWDTELTDVFFEIQITTQLQETIRRLLHNYYETNRIEFKNLENVKWQWNYRDDEFSANYLGHILHYVEGMIMEIREKQGEKC